MRGHGERAMEPEPALVGAPVGRDQRPGRQHFAPKIALLVVWGVVEGQSRVAPDWRAAGHAAGVVDRGVPGRLRLQRAAVSRPAGLKAGHTEAAQYPRLVPPPHPPHNSPTLLFFFNQKTAYTRLSGLDFSRERFRSFTQALLF